ncbi:MAG: HD domain-containing protein [Cellulosilyticaceae bacterium]
MKRYEEVLGDEKIIKIYEQIEEVEAMTKGSSHHGMMHVTNVAALVALLLSKLGYDEAFIEEVKIAAILHDVGALEGKENHAERGYLFAKRYLEEKGIVLEYEDRVLEAIKNHSEGFESTDMIVLALILGDKLDIKNTRLAKEGYNIKGMRQLQYIKDIVVDIERGFLEVQFICADEIDKAELETFYFLKKVAKAIQAFAKQVNVIPRVFLNDKEWGIFEICD